MSRTVIGIPGRAATFAALTALLTGCMATTSPPAAEPQATVDPKLEPVTGISTDALLAVIGSPDLDNEMLYSIFYQAAKADPAQLAAAPARLCKARGLRLISAEDKTLDHPQEAPGARKLVVRCR